MFIKKKSKKAITIFDRFFLKINKSPVIILGNQKSGTSAIAHLLADYSGLSKTIDIPEIWPPTLLNLLTGKNNLQSFAQKYPKRFAKDIIKEPNLTFFYQDLKKNHPNASFIFIVRDPRSNIRSILDRLSLPGNLEKLNVDKTSLTKPWWHMFNASLWNLGCYDHYIDILAARWNLAVGVFLVNKDSDNILLVRYEDFVKDKLGTIQELAKKLGLVQVNEIVNKLDIQYQPAGNNNSSWLDFFGSNNLARIETICHEKMQIFGYLISHR